MAENNSNDAAAAEAAAKDVDGKDEAAKKAAAAAEHKKKVAADCAELGIKPDKDGKVEIELLVSLAGANVKAAGEKHVCGPAEAVRMIRAGFAKLGK